MKTALFHNLRIDARSLGAFRVALGVALIANLFDRWAYSASFYSNEGVLPNHNHLFLLGDEGRVWSLFHAVSTNGEASFFMFVTLIVYLGFTLGIRTRIMHALSLTMLVSLVARNTLAESTGDYAALAVLCMTLLLPCGSRFSYDSIRARLAQRDEKSDEDLNRRDWPSEDENQALHGPGYSPLSLAAFGALAQVMVIVLVSSFAHGDAWRAGTALGRAVHWQLWASDIGVMMRSPGAAGILSALTRLVHYAGFAIPILILFPVGRIWARLAASVLLLVYGLTFGLVFDLGLYGWVLVSAALLVLPTELWQRWAKRWSKSRAVTIIYDADCGICLWLSRVLVRLDAHQHLTLQGNNKIDKLRVREPGGKVHTRAMPKGVNDELVDSSALAIDRDGNVFARGRAVSAAIAALPGGRPVAFVLRLPGIAQLLDVMYNAIAKRRLDISVSVGFAACGIPDKKQDGEGRKTEDWKVTPAARWAHRLGGALRETLAAILLVTMFIQTGKVNDLPIETPSGEVFEEVAHWSRMLGKWDVFSPEPPVVQGMLVVDAQTRGEHSVDLMTGVPAQFDVERGPRLGPMWAAYVDRIHREEYAGFQKALRESFSRFGGPGWPANEEAAFRVTGLDAYWVSAPVGDVDVATVPEPDRLFRYSRGGRAETAPPLSPAVRPGVNVRPSRPRNEPQRPGVLRPPPAPTPLPTGSPGAPRE